MATYRVRNLFCLQCDEPVRSRNEIIDGVEALGDCPECRRPLVQLGKLNLTMPRGSTQFTPSVEAWRNIWDNG